MLGRASRVSDDFAEWCAKNIGLHPPYVETLVEISNIGDWIEASYEKYVRAAVVEMDRITPYLAVVGQTDPGEIDSLDVAMLLAREDLLPDVGVPMP